jgi:hypothetical protein
VLYGSATGVSIWTRTINHAYVPLPELLINSKKAVLRCSGIWLVLL